MDADAGGAGYTILLRCVTDPGAASGLPSGAELANLSRMRSLVEQPSASASTRPVQPPTFQTTTNGLVAFITGLLTVPVGASA
jgi:hypothetical protein